VSPGRPLHALPMPVRVLHIDALIACPTCREGVRFVHTQPVEPWNGIQVACPKCHQLLGVRLDCVDLGRAGIVSG
jgi:hypothetical protein